MSPSRSPLPGPASKVASARRASAVLGPLLLAGAVLSAGLLPAAAPDVARAASVPRGTRPHAKALVHGVRLRWKKPHGVRRTVIERRDLTVHQRRWRRERRTVHGRHRTLRGLEAGHRYRFRLRFRIHRRTGRPGRSIRVRVPGRTPPEVARVQVTAAGTTGIALSWARVPGAQGYRVERADAATGASERLPGAGEGSDRVDVPPARLKGHWLRYRVISRDGRREAAPTASAEVRAPGIPAYRTFYALGDSYAAGTGLGQPYDDQECARSNRMWAALIPRSIVGRAPSLLACSGAKTDDVRLSRAGGGRRQFPDLPGTQLDRVKRDLDARPGPSLITISIGGNDAQFIPQFTRCVVGNCLGDRDTETALIRGPVRRKLDATFAQIHLVAPAADVLVAGYPRLFDEGPISGDPIFALTLTQDERRLANVWADQVDHEVAASARAHGLHPVVAPVVDAFEGHGAGGPAPWINPVVLADPHTPPGVKAAVPATESLHPNVAGNSAYATAVTRALREYARVARVR